ncbi:glutathione S-transferase [Actibacterium mucosum KCTC 23349]|uniref:Glutathione S-transferase n=1 Tax=Actibacterium mucosum KCTC 23349 TaxID=1454373 RepID=A0A037ZJR6_9RHOB|nr:glutathione S-transferase [Actibacterium mucosum]KAJ55071.1 glutathione S-transferase [Actibacterium mucosum KCTC 23349]
MTYDLFIGDRTFSSWSLRGWLLFEKFDIPFKTTMVGLYSGTMAQDLAPYAPARLVPTIQTPQGDPLQDTLAIAETLAEHHPEAGIWPADPSARVLARWVAAEMHSGFGALRSECPMNLGTGYNDFAVSDGVKADLERIETLWATARAKFGGTSPWLFGKYSAADAFYAPVAARIAGYGLPVSDAAQAYVAAHLSDPAFRRWRAMGLTKSYDFEPYPMDAEKAPWPGPAPLPAQAVDSGKNAENTLCPYSKKEMTHFLQVDGRVFGFCNAFCRDKTVNDPLAWSAFAEIYQS